MKKTKKPTLRSQAHLQGAQSWTQSQPCKRVSLHPRTGNTLLILMLVLWTVHINAQTQPKINYNLFNRPPLGQLQILTPQPAMFTPIDINHFNSPINFPSQPNPILNFNNPIEQQNQQLLQQYNMLPGQISDEKRAAINESIKQDINDFVNPKRNSEEMEWLAKSQSYRQAYNELSKLNPDSFSITKAVFTIENAYYGNKLSYTSLNAALKERATLVKQILQREGLSSKNNLALNYGIQKLYSQQNIFYNSKTKQTISVPKIKYDFDDFMGEKDYSKMFAWKLLATGKGQCHSMPLLYLMIAEQLNAKAYLSLAPEHSFIQFLDRNKNIMNFETTNGNLVSNTWLAQSGYITAQALQNKTYLDTLSQRKLYAQMLSDLLLGYLDNFSYDDFAEQMRQRILQINADNTTALIIDANIKRQIAFQKIKAAGSPKEDDLPNYPDAYNAYLDMQTAFEKIDNIGYQDMPKEAYQKWLQSIEEEKKKQANQELKQKMQKELQQLKNQKPVLQNKTKG